jgi:hypothetical protein
VLTARSPVTIGKLAAAHPNYTNLTLDFFVYMLLCAYNFDVLLSARFGSAASAESQAVYGTIERQTGGDPTGCCNPCMYVHHQHQCSVLSM